MNKYGAQLMQVRIRDEQSLELENECVKEVLKEETSSNHLCL